MPLFDSGRAGARFCFGGLTRVAVCYTLPEVSKRASPFAIRLPDALRAAYEAEAERTHQTLAQTIRAVLWAHKPDLGAK